MSLSFITPMALVTTRRQRYTIRYAAYTYHTYLVLYVAHTHTSREKIT